MYEQHLKDLEDPDIYDEFVNKKYKKKIEKELSINYEFPSRYTLTDKEVSEEVKELKLNDSKYENVKKISVPKWAEDLSPMNSFYELKRNIKGDKGENEKEESDDDQGDKK